MVPKRGPALITPAEINAFAADVYPALAASGVRCVAAGQGRAETVWPFDESALRPGGYISGPTQFALADSSLWFATFTLLGLEAMAVTSDLHMSFLRPARNGDLRALAKVVSQSRTRIHGVIRLWVGDDPDRLVSHAVGTYAVP